MIKLTANSSYLRGVGIAVDRVLHSSACVSCVEIPESQILCQRQRPVSSRHFTSLRVINNAMMSRARCKYKGSHVACPMYLLFQNTIFRRHNSTSLSNSVTEKFKNHYLLETWHNVVHPFGKLSVKGPLSVYVESLNPHEHPGMDHAFVTVYVKQDYIPDRQNREKSFKCDVNMSDQGKQLSIKASKPDKLNNNMTDNLPPLECHIQVPIKYGVSVEVEENSCVTVSNLESSDIKIKCGHGRTVLNNIRAGFVSVESVGGNIRSENILQGNIDLKTGLDGEITCQKVQGINVRGQTYSGRLQIKTIYGDNSIFWSNTGAVDLGSCHGDTAIDVYRGNISIDSMDGNLAAHVQTSGSVDVSVIRHEAVHISVGKGNVNLKLPETVNTSANIIAEKINIDSGFKTAELKFDEGDRHTTVSGSLGAVSSEEGWTSNSLKASTRKGEITLKCYDWLTSLKNSQHWKS